ncbi:WASH complex subunit 2C-like [Rhinophrynus dorsalis]
MNGPAEQPVWERPWSLDEIRRSSQNWSLGADAGLLNFLREFSQQTISRTHEIEKQLDGLIREAKSTDCRLHNVFNDFLMLSNTQFIENRVYDEEVEEHVVKSDAGDKTEQEKTREQKEAELIPKIQEAVNYGLQVLESAFEQLDIKAGNSDSEEDEVNERVELILEPKDLYIDRPLPCLIGSQLFMQQEDVGLGDLSSEEGSVDNDRGSIIDSDEEKDDEESENESGDNSEEEKKLPSELSDEDEDNGSDLFGESDKEEEEENDKSTKTRTKSFADELAARIQGDVPKKQEADQSSISSLEVKTKKEQKVKKRLSDEDDDIFKPPKLTDEDFLPFGSKGGLFSGGKGLFDDDEEGDLFADVQSKEIKQTEPSPVVNSEPLPSSVKKKPPVGGVSLFPGGENVIGSSILADKEKKKHLTPTVETAPKLPASTGLFDDDDALFGGSHTEQPTSKTVKSKPASGLFADEDDLFEENISIPHLAVNKVKGNEAIEEKENLERKNQQVPNEKSKPPGPLTKKQTRGLFSDEDDSESDLFAPSQSASKSKTAVLPSTKPSKALSLFDDEDEEDLFGSVPEKKPLSTSEKPMQKTVLPAESKVQKSGLFSSDEEDISISQKKTVEQNETKKDVVIAPKEKTEKKLVKTSLFDEEDDLFAFTKESQKKPLRVSLLFEEDTTDEGPFSSQSTPATNAGQTPDQSKPSVPSKPVNADLKDSLFGNLEKKVESKAPISEKEPPSLTINEKVKQVAVPEPQDVKHDDLFGTSPPVDKYTKIKSKNVLSLFEEEENVEDQPAINITQKESGKAASDKSSHTKSTGVFQDEELLFSQELQKDNDPDVDLFASTKKQSTDKSSHTKSSSGSGLFGDEEDDDLFSTNKPKKPPKVQEKKTVIKREQIDSSSQIDKVPEVKEADFLKTDHEQKPAGSASIKPKAASSRIGKLQANLQINPAAMLPGAVPKLTGARSGIPGASAPAHVNTSPTSSQSVEGVSFENPAQVDTLHNANKTRVKMTGKRRPPTRMGKKIASQDSSETEDLSESTVSYASDIKCEVGPSQKLNQEFYGDNTSTIKLSASENDVQSRAETKVTRKPLTPENDLFGSDLFAKTSAPSQAALKKQEVLPEHFFTSMPVPEPKKKSALVLEEEHSDDDLFQTVKQKSKKTLTPASLKDSELEDDLFGVQKTQKKEDVKSIPPKEVKTITSNIFEDDIFATEVVKPVKKVKESTPAVDPNLFDENLDIFADLTHKPKEKKTKKKVESKSIFDDDMDDIFSTGNPKKTKQKVKSSPPTTEVKSESKVSSAFDDPLNVLGK